MRLVTMRYDGSLQRVEAWIVPVGESAAPGSDQLPGARWRSHGRRAGRLREPVNVRAEHRRETGPRMPRGGVRQPRARRVSCPPLDHHLLDLCDCLCGVEVFGAGLGAVHDGVAAVGLERVVALVEALAGGLVATVDDPAAGARQGRRPEVAVAVPSAARARCRAAGAYHAVVEAVELAAVLDRPQPLLLGRDRPGFEPRLDRGCRA